LLDMSQNPHNVLTADRPSARQRFQLLARKFEIFDALIFVYIAAFVREYLWLIHENLLAWILTVVVSLAFSAIYLTTKKTTTEKTPPVFWFVVGLPLLFVFSLRVAYPDLSFDVLNYHIFHSERALRGLLHIPGDFAPAYFPFFNNPVSDMITGMFRHLLGYRSGTIVNYLALLWTGAILFKFFRQDIRNPRLRALAVLCVLFSEQLLSEINNYMVDLLALPLLLQATWLALRDDAEGAARTNHLVGISLLLGASIALKLTNLVFAFPIGLILLGRLALRKPRDPSRTLGTLLAMAVALLLPVIPYTLYLYMTTGSPVFPLYNKLFQSPYWVNENVFDGRWGPIGIVETLLWPFKILFTHERLTELNVYSGRMSFGLCAALLLLLFVRQRRAKTIGFITVVGALLWSLGTGYIRYGLFLEVLGGVCLIVVGAHLWRLLSNPIVRRALAALFVVALLAQAILAAFYTFRVEWGGRSTGPEHQREYRVELLQLFRDRSLKRYLKPDQLNLFDDVGVWVESSYKTSAITGMLRPDVPYINMFADAFTSTPAAMQRFREALKTVAGRKMVSITFQDDLEMAIARLKQRGFAVTRSTPLQFPYYSFQRRLALVVLEVVPDPAGQLQGIFNAEVSIQRGVTTLSAGQRASVLVKVRNASGGVWLARDSPDGTHQVTLGNKWLDESGRILINDDGRTPLPQDLAPGGELELELQIRAPATPGKYLLMLDLVQEHVAWFFEKGSTPAQLTVIVER